MSWNMGLAATRYPPLGYVSAGFGFASYIGGQAPKSVAGDTTNAITYIDYSTGGYHSRTFGFSAGELFETKWVSGCKEP